MDTRSVALKPASKTEIKPKDSLAASAIKNLPDDVIVRAIRDVMSKDRKRNKPTNRK